MFTSKPTDMNSFSNLFLILLLSLLINPISAQTYSHDLGVVTDYERDMKTYDKDTSAEAVVIYDIGESGFYNIDNGFDLYFNRQTKIKVLKKSYIKNAVYSIPLYKGNRGKEEIRNFEAVTYNFKNGQVIKTAISKDQLYTEHINKHWDNVKFAISDVQVGSIIEFKYKTVSPYHFLFHDWEFQNYIPTIYSEYKAKMIPFYAYQYRLQGAKKFDVENEYEESGLKKQFYNVKYSDKVYQFIMKDTPAFKNEPYITSRNDYIMKLDFQLATVYQYGGGSIKVLSTWPELSKKLENGAEFGMFIKRCKNNFKKISPQLELLSKPDIEKAKTIINYIKSNYNWNGHSGIHSSKTVNKLIKEKTGSIADINLYLIGALKSQDIEVYPVILSTRAHGKIVTKYPFLDPFNYVLAYAKINDKFMLLDATDTYCPYNKIPEKCYNDLGLIINKKEPKWLKIRQQKLSVTQYSIVSDLSVNGDSLTGHFIFKTTDYDAIKYRKKFKNDISKIENYFSDKNIEIFDSIKTENYEDTEKKYIIKFTASSLSDRIGDKIIIDPFFFFPINDNPLKSKTRRFPIDMIYPKVKFYTNKISIPDKYKIEKLPEDYFFNTPLFSLTYKVEQENNVINVNASYQFKKAVYSPEEYSKIKRYFNVIIKNMNQKIVLTEK